MTKDTNFGLHFQRIPSWSSELISTMDVGWIKVIDPPDTNPFPGKQILGRIYHEEGADNELIMQGRDGAEEYFRQCVPTYNRVAYVKVWEGPNEPPVGTQEQRAKLSEFTLRWIELMHNEGLQTAALSLSVGWPAIGTASEFADVALKADYWSLHEYSAPRMQDGQGWYCLRHRNTARELAEVGVFMPKTFITETGIDGGVLPNGSRRGWKTYANSREDYFEQLLWYDEETKKDSYIMAFTPFTSGPYPDWVDFNFDEELVKMLGIYLDTLPVPPPVPPPVFDEDVIRQACWDRQNVPYNPNAALQKFAAEECLMAPLGPEFDVGDYRVQAYADGIVYCKIGHWDDVQWLSWHKRVGIKGRG